MIFVVRFKNMTEGMSKNVTYMMNLEVIRIVLGSEDIRQYNLLELMECTKEITSMSASNH